MAVSIRSYHSVVSVAFSVLTVSLTISSFLPTVTEASNVGFSVDLIHRDSPKSPFYNPSQTPFLRFTNALQRSIKRASRHFSASPDPPFSRVIPDDGSYLMNISIGTPPVEFLAIADTGSDLTWIQCTPCVNCFKQNAPLFDPLSSSTYQEIPCNSPRCNDVGSQCPQNASSKAPCEYQVIYADASRTKGVIATETVMLGMSSSSGQPISQAQTVFGCGLNNSGFYSGNTAGIVGLGGSPRSVISQVDSLIDGKFSYCLVPMTQTNMSSKMYFGSEAVVSGSDVVSTPMAADPSSVSFYVLTLEAISVGDDVKLVFDDPKRNKSSAADQGNMIIDSGTTQTVLPSDFYYDVESAVKKAIDLEPMKDPPNFSPPLCYRTQSDVQAPTITVHFRGGADVRLNSSNTFLRAYDDVVCFSFAPSEDEGAVYGNLSQMNFLVGYDLKRRTVSFKPTDCTNQIWGLKSWGADDGFVLLEVLVLGFCVYCIGNFIFLFHFIAFL